MVWVAPTAVGQVQGQEVRPSDAAAFDQQRALEHMRELEQRMYQLAETISADQPEDAQRLLLGLRRSRDELIVQRMGRIIPLLESLELDRAAADQRQVLDELIALRELLLSTDLDLELALEELRQMRSALEQIDRLIETEGDQQEQTEGLEGEGSEGQNGEPSENGQPGQPGQMSEAERAAMQEMLEQTERSQQQQAAELAEELGQREPSEPGEGQGEAEGSPSQSMQQASESMGQASESLSQGQAGEASESQGEAIEQMQQAQDQLEQQQQQLQQEIEQRVRQAVLENLRSMLEEQERITPATRQAGEALAAGRRQALVTIAELAEAQGEVGRVGWQTLEMIELVEYSVTLPRVLELICDRIDYASSDLDAGRADAMVVERQTRIESDLRELIEAVEQSNAGEPQPGQPQTPQQEAANEMLQMLAELRLLRLMQVGVNEQTQQVDGQRVDGRLSAGELARQAEDLRYHQDRVREATELLRMRAAGAGPNRVPDAIQ
jgi:hypothetical protein